MRLKWAIGLVETDFKIEAKAEAKLAKDLLLEVLGPDAALVTAASDLLDKLQGK